MFAFFPHFQKACDFPIHTRPSSKGAEYYMANIRVKIRKYQIKYYTNQRKYYFYLRTIRYERRNFFIHTVIHGDRFLLQWAGVKSTTSCFSSRKAIIPWWSIFRLSSIIRADEKSSPLFSSLSPVFRYRMICRQWYQILALIQNSVSLFIWLPSLQSERLSYSNIVFPFVV